MFNESNSESKNIQVSLFEKKKKKKDEEVLKMKRFSLVSN